MTVRAGGDGYAAGVARPFTSRLSSIGADISVHNSCESAAVIFSSVHVNKTGRRALTARCPGQKMMIWIRGWRQPRHDVHKGKTVSIAACPSMSFMAVNSEVT